jgi:hypothetical protein
MGRFAQIPKIKIQTSNGLVFDVYLVFGVWCLNFKPEGFRYG